jgi:hypothetical protein
MFGLFKDRNRDPKCPVSEDMRKWLDYAFNWLTLAFGEEQIITRKVLTPHHTDFPIRYDGEENSAKGTIEILALQMEIDPDDIHLDVYSEGESKISTGSPFGNAIYLNQFDDEKYSGGLYFGKEKDGKYHIGLERQKLLSPESMIATLAHELAHIKLLGENGISENDERLTDLTTTVFGLGIFNANAAFNSFQTINSHGWSNLAILPKWNGVMGSRYSRISDVKIIRIG